MIFDCECSECIWNEDGECNAPAVLITNGGVCDAYEESEEARCDD